MEEKFYITTAIDYANDKPHLGHALEKIQADVLARFARQEGKRTRFLTGTDEHGQKIQRKAEAEGKAPQELVDINAKKFLQLKEDLNLSFDDFIRTSDRKRHWPGVQKMWHSLAEKGDIYKKSYKGLYCVGHEAFITEKDLEDGKCKDHAKEPELIEEENYFFKLSKYAPQIKQKIESGEVEIVPDTRKNEILSLIEQGLEDVSFSRPRKDLSWGIPVPGDEEQTIYVWADALTNYISAVGYGLDGDYSKWWPADVQIIGKDILRFHAAIWPGMLIAAGLPLPRRLVVHGFITVDGQKMSKTIGNVVDPVELTKKYGIDPVRYYLLKEIPSGEDGDFSEEKFKALYNGDLANGLGNFTARVLKLGEGRKFNVQEPKEQARTMKDAVGSKVAEFKLNEALFAIWRYISFGDAYLNERRPWETKDEEVIGELLNMLNLLSICLEPFLPDTANKIASALNEKEGFFYPQKGENLFPRL